MIKSDKTSENLKAREICQNLSSLNEDEISRLESIMPNFQFISDLLATDIMVFTQSKNATSYTLLDIKKPHGHPTLFMESQVGKIVSSDKEPFVKKTYETGKKELGIHGVMISGRPTQQVVYPIYHYEKIIAVIVFEKDLYLTESLLGKYWNIVADDLVGALNQKRHRLKHWPVLTGQEGFILTDSSDEIIYCSYLAHNLLISILGIRDKPRDIKLSVLLKDFPPEVIENEPVINLTKGRLTGIRGTIEFTSFDLSENNRIHVLRDISELFLKEKEIRVKGALVKEIHHRVKNNLNAVAALLRMQIRRSKDPAVKEAISQAILRLDSINLVHEFLSQVDNVQSVAIGQLVKDICRNLQHTLAVEDKSISVEINCPDEFHLYSKQAVSVALIVNELISNCYEHAFKNKKEGKIILHINHTEKDFSIVISDDGNGFPGGFDIEKSSGLGWHIINTLVKEDLDGTIYLGRNLESDFGTEVKIEASISEKRG